MTVVITGIVSAACIALTTRNFDQCARDAWPWFSGGVLAELAGRIGLLNQGFVGET